MAYDYPKEMDSREPGIIREKLYEMGWSQKQLYSGDYRFWTHDYKKVGITRKRVDDLLGSLSGIKTPDGKRRQPLPKQLEEMLDEYHILIFLIEGSWQMVRPTQRIISTRGIEYHTWSMVWNFLRRWQDKGFTIELTVNEGHTVQRLNELYALYQKPYSLSARSRDYTDERVLAFPPGCRGKTGIDCLKFFGSLTNVGMRSESDLMYVDGVGAKKANLIYNHFNREDVSDSNGEGETEDSKGNEEDGTTEQEDVEQTPVQAELPFDEQ